MTSAASLAVIIPTCNRPRQLEDCINSVLPQLQPGTDYIYIVNDGDPESVTKKVSGMANVMLIEHCKDYYARASALNAALKEAFVVGHDYGLILDDDCTLRPDAIHYHREAWEVMAQINSRCLYIGAIHQMPYGIDLRFAPEYGGLKAALMRYGGTVNLSFPLAAVWAARGFDERFDGQWGFEDAEFYSRLILRDGWEVIYIKNSVVEHQFKQPANASYSRETFDKNQALYESLVETYKTQKGVK